MKDIKSFSTEVKNYADSQSKTASHFAMEAMDAQMSKNLMDTSRRRQESALKQLQQYVHDLETMKETVVTREQTLEQSNDLITKLNKTIAILSKLPPTPVLREPREEPQPQSPATQPQQERGG